VVLLGDSRDELGGSEYLRVMHGLIRGVPPVLDLTRESALQSVLVAGASAGVIRSAHDCSEGGLAVTIAECCFDSGHGVDVNVAAVAAADASKEALSFGDVRTLYGESASRVVVSVSAARAPELLALAAAAGVPARQIGVVGGSRIQVSVEGRPVLDETLADAEGVWATAIAGYFERAQAIA
jgi:phosphoribosylformylglycinamidine synthase subunit PurL